MYFPSETSLLKACRILFGQEANLSRDFLYYLQPSGARSAFRDLAKAHHPDRHAGSSAQNRSQQTERFREIRQAYELISEFLAKRPHSHPNSPTSPAPSRASHEGANPSYRRRPQPSQGRTSPVPAIPLEFGMYSYYLGKVSYQQLIEALVWQRRQRPSLGAIARKWGWLSEAGVAQILGHRGHAVRFGKKAIELGYLKPYQVEALLRHQRSQQQRIGRYFVDRGLLTEAEADQLARDLEVHNSQLGRRTSSGCNRF